MSKKLTIDYFENYFKDKDDIASDLLNNIYRIYCYYDKLLIKFKNQKKLKEFTLYHNSHYSNSDIYNYYLKDMPEALAFDYLYKYKKFGHSYEKYTSEEQYVDFNYHCFICGEGSRFKISADGFEPSFYSKPCAYPDGIVSFKTNFNIYSGKAIFTDNLLKFFKDKDKSFSINCDAGKKDTSKYWEQHNFAVGIVGDGRLNLFLNKNNNTYYILYKCGEDDEIPKNWEFISQISLELWWFFLGDASECEEIDFKSKKPEYFALEKGKYEVTHYEVNNGFKYKKMLIMAKFKKVEEK